MTTTIEKAVQPHRAKGQSLVARFSNRFGVEPEKLLATLKATAFKGDGKKEISNEQMMALLVVADQYGLNPWTKEIYAFPDGGGIVPVVGVDGWIRIMNDHPQFDGIQFKETPDKCTAIIYRKDRARATEVTEYMDEVKRNTKPWQSHPRRMLRHKATIQAARLAFGFTGIHDQDEAENILERDITPPDEIVTPQRNTIDIDQLTLPEVEPAPAPTYAQVADMINNAQSEEESKHALDMSDGLPPDQRAELAALHVSAWKGVHDETA